MHQAPKGDTDEPECAVLSMPSQIVRSLGTAIRSFLSHLADGATVVLVTHEAAAAEADRILAGCAGDVTTNKLVIDDAVPFSPWLRDGLHVARGDGILRLLTPESTNAAKSAFLQRVADAVDLRLQRVAGLPDDGNVLPVADGVLIGGNDWTDALPVGTLVAPGCRARAVASRLTVPVERVRNTSREGEPWREIVSRGNRPGTRQPTSHLDIFVTPAGRSADGTPRLMIGDPALAARMLDHPRWQYATPEIFDDIAAQLAGDGYAVLRNPLPLVYCDDVARHERQWYFASGNNAVVRHGDGGGIVWLPAYGHGEWPELAHTDAANAALWRDCGYEVRMVEGCLPLARNSGGLKYMVRII